MGFLERPKTLRLWLEEPTDETEGWWVDLRETVSVDNYSSVRAAMRLQISAKADDGGKVRVDQNLYAGDIESVAVYVVDWNLTDENDKRLSTAPKDDLRRSLRRLPLGTFLRLKQVIDKLDNPAGGGVSEEDLRFRVGRDVDGEGEPGGQPAPGRDGVLYPQSVLEADGDPVGWADGDGSAADEVREVLPRT